MYMYKYLLFDFDNTLVDFDAASHKSLHDVAERLQVEANDAFFKVFKEINHEMWSLFERRLLTASDIKRNRFKRLAEHYGKKVDASLLNRLFLRKLVDNTELIEGAKDVLQLLGNNHQLVIITNGFREVQRPRIEKVGLTSYFSHIFVSDEIHVAKPDVAFFEHVHLHLKGCNKEELLVIGDNPNSDILGAHNYGIDSCYYNNKHKNNETPKSTFEINELSELITILGNLDSKTH